MPRAGAVSIAVVARAGVWLGAAIGAGAFAWVVLDIVANGGALISWTFLTRSVEDAGRAGGIGPVLVSTGLILGIALAVAVPVSIGTGWLLVEYGGAAPRLVTVANRSLHIMASIPSIIFGLLGNALFSKAFGLGFSILSGGLTLACMILPFLVSAAEQELRAAVGRLGPAIAAIALTRTSALLRVLLPVALPGLCAGIVLALARAAAETAALVFTSGYVARLPDSVLDSGRALSVHVLDLAMNVPGGSANAYKSAFVLLIALLIVNSASLSFASYWHRRARLAW